MKKTLIFILTFITLISVFALPAFAEEGAIKDDITKEESSEFIPTIGATDESSEAEGEGEIGDVELKFSTDNMSKTLEHMGLGLLGVMIVLGLIACVVLVLNKIFKN